MLTFVIFSTLLVSPILSVPTAGNSMVVTTEANEKESDFKEGSSRGDIIEIYEMRIDSNVSNRFARTLVTSKVRNLKNLAQEATFSVVLPKQAFISEFVMIIKGISYKAYVKEKKEAKEIYDRAIESGTGAAHVAVDARDSNRFTVSVNVEPQEKATFLLTYEELLVRKEKMYELVINIQPKQLITDLNVYVMINESRPLTFVKTASIRSGNDISKQEGDLDPQAQVAVINETTAVIEFKPNIEKQKALAKNLGSNVDEGLSGQFVVQYDVDHDPNGGEVLLQDGYFVHFFSPKNIKPLNKYVLFVLDTSGSMYGEKMTQLKTAMKTILSQLNEKDFFHIISFDSYTKVWDLNNATKTDIHFGDFPTNEEIDTENTKISQLHAFPANADNLKKAKTLVSQLSDQGVTDIHTSLLVALKLVRQESKLQNDDFPQPMIMFLTDGSPNSGISSVDKITSDITRINVQKVPIFSVSFGRGADKDFLKKLSLLNSGFSRHIYEASDAALQLENFYKQISSPLLRDVKFKYTPETISLTQTKFPIYFDESEIVVSGKLDMSSFSEIPIVSCITADGSISLRPVIERPVTSLERLWAYLTVKQLLENREIAENKTSIEDKALNLALQYSFVTALTSLVVVKPNASEAAVNPEETQRKKSFEGFMNRAGMPSGVTYRSGYSTSFKSAVQPTYFLRASLQPFTRARAFISSTDSDDFDSITMPISPTLNFDSSKKDTLMTKLPWLRNLLNANDTLKSPPGNYRLGLDAILPDNPDCPLTPTNTTGHCKLLNECPQVFSLLDTESTYLKYFCHIDEYAGICCPKEDTIVSR